MFKIPTDPFLKVRHIMTPSSSIDAITLFLELTLLILEPWDIFNLYNFRSDAMEYNPF